MYRYITVHVLKMQKMQRNCANLQFNYLCHNNSNKSILKYREIVQTCNSTTCLTTIQLAVSQ